MTDSTTTALRIVGQCPTHNHLYAIEAVLAGFDTPLLDSKGLREHVETFKAADADEVTAAVKARHRVVAAEVSAMMARQMATTTDFFHYQGLKVPVVTIEV